MHGMALGSNSDFNGVTIYREIIHMNVICGVEVFCTRVHTLGAEAETPADGMVHFHF